MKRFRLLRADEIECRIATITQKGLSLLLYKDARCDMNILDETVGEMNWQKEYCRDNRNCIVSIWDSEKNQWISKEDTGTESNTESEKGLASDSFKRACFNWGIGRELYTAPFIWIYGDKCTIYEERGKFKCRDSFKVLSISYDAEERISGLCIVNKKTGEEVFRLGDKTPAEAKQTAQAADYGKSVTELKTIGTVKAKALQEEIASRGVPAEFVCQLYKVSALKDLNESQHKNIHDHIEKLVQAYMNIESRGADE